MYNDVVVLGVLLLMSTVETTYLGLDIISMFANASIFRRKNTNTLHLLRDACDHGAK